MSLGGVLLGLIDIGIVVAILFLIGAIAMWIMSAIGWPVPANVQKIYIGVVGLIALYMIVALLLGFPSVHLLNLR
jgi:hypothetical protein